MLTPRRPSSSERDDAHHGLQLLQSMEILTSAWGSLRALRRGDHANVVRCRSWTSVAWPRPRRSTLHGYSAPPRWPKKPWPRWVALRAGGAGEGVFSRRKVLDRVWRPRAMTERAYRRPVAGRTAKRAVASAVAASGDSVTDDHAPRAGEHSSTMGPYPLCRRHGSGQGSWSAPGGDTVGRRREIGGAATSALVPGTGGPQCAAGRTWPARSTP